MWFKGLIALAALAVVAVCGMQAGYVLNARQGVITQASAPAAQAKGKIIQVDGGGGM